MDRHNSNTTHEGTQDRGVPRGDHVVDPAHEGGANAGTDGGATPETGKSADGRSNAVSDGLGPEVGPASAIEEK